MQAALHTDEGNLSKSEKDAMFKEVAQRRSEHQAILTEAMVYKLQCKCIVILVMVMMMTMTIMMIMMMMTILYFVVEEQSHRAQNPKMSDEEGLEDLSVVLLADLQEKQATESATVQNLTRDMVTIFPVLSIFCYLFIDKTSIEDDVYVRMMFDLFIFFIQEEKDLQEVKRVQRIARREGWFDALTGMLFQLSGSDPSGEEAELEILDKRMADMEEDWKKEKDMLIAEGEFVLKCLCDSVYLFSVNIRDIKENSCSITWN